MNLVTAEDNYINLNETNFKVALKWTTKEGYLINNKSIAFPIVTLHYDKTDNVTGADIDENILIELTICNETNFPIQSEFPSLNWDFFYCLDFSNHQLKGQAQAVNNSRLYIRFFK